jgi:hypothetical protein
MNAYHGGASEHDLLARRENLTPVEHCAEAGYAYGHEELELLLRRYGPIFFYWMKTADGQTYGHASVLIGVQEMSPDLTFHDPENAPNSLMSLDDFNRQRQRWQYALMRRAGSGHTIRAFDA